MRLALLSILALDAATGPARACSCAETPPDEMFDFSDAVFSGYVLAVETLQGPYSGFLKRATIQVFDCWKGAPGEVAFVWTPPDGAVCGYDFTDGIELLVYATDFPEFGYWTALCSRTQPWPPEQEDLDFLGEPGSCAPVSVHDGTWGRTKSLYR